MMRTDEHGAGIVLIVEDPFVCAFIRTYLTRHRLSAISLDAGEAEQRLRSGGLAVDLLITNRPARFAALLGDVPLLYVAAFPDPSEAAGFERCHMLRKPFHPEQLLTAVTSLLGIAVAS